MLQLHTRAKASGDCVPLEGKLILAIESSCNETAAALIDESRNHCLMMWLLLRSIFAPVLVG